MSENTAPAEVYGGPIDYHPSILTHLEEGLIKNPHGLALVAMHQNSNDLSQLIGTEGIDPASDSKSHVSDKCFQWTHTQLHRAAKKLATGLLAKGIQPGSTLVTMIPNRAEWAVLYVVAAILRLTLASLDSGALSPSRRPELLNFLETLKPDTIAVSNVEDIGSVENALEASEVHRPFGIVLDVGATGNVPPGWESLIKIAEASDGTDESNLLERAREADPDRISLVVFTSGTSIGKPKGCPRTVSAIIQSTVLEAPSCPMDEKSRFPLIGANFRIIAPIFLMRTLTAGGALIMPGAQFSSSSFLTAIQDYGITNILMVPFQLHLLVADPFFSSYDLQSLKYAAFGADMITKDFLIKAAKALPSARVSTMHGMSEAGAFFYWPFGEIPIEDVPYFGDISPLGYVAPGSRLRIYDYEKGKIAERNQPGEFHASGPQIIYNYLGGVNADMFYEDSTGRWFKTGDVAFMRDDGLFFILGRIKDTIMRSGIPITPAALESCIEKFTGSYSSVVGMPHPTMGQEPFAVVKSFGGKTEEEIKQEILNKFGKDYAIGGVLSLEQLGLEEFPVNATAKIVKIDLQEKISKYLT